MQSGKTNSHSGSEKEFIAHCRKKDGVKQSLWHHLTEASSLAGRFASKIGLENQGELLGLLHDLGKASQEFDRYIKSATGLIDSDEDDYVDVVAKKGKIDHSSAGAQFLYQYYSNKGNKSLLISQIFSLIIASHHSGLIDCLTTDGVDNYSRRMNKPVENTHLEEAVSNLDDYIKLKIETMLSDSQLINMFNQVLVSLREENDSSETCLFKIGLLIKFLFSCLIDADRLNTADFEFPEQAKRRNQGHYEKWSVLANKLELHLKEFKNEKRIDIIRQDISNHCLDFSSKPKGLYQLTVPTGGGKTLSSLRFALNHAKKHNIDRIIYVVPFTSIIDQNAQKAREALEEQISAGIYANDIVLEHHSNLTPEMESTRQKLLSENWDMPVVYTTMVHFLDTLFGYGTRDVRRMHQLANAVIIFDEIQTLPIRCVQLFNIAVRFLVKSCGSTVVLCTATQPLLDKITPPQRALQITPEQQMMPDVRKLFQELKRVNVYDYRKNAGWADSDVAKLVKQELDRTGSVLVVVNTKKEAINLFQELQKFQHRVFHLSTNMCPAHRMAILNEIKGLLGKEPVICVSTQLIEAGIDIDFGSVIRYLAGLDSIGQAAGRCNRNDTRTIPGKVFIVNSKDENLDKLKDIKIGREKAERVLGEFRDNPIQFDEDIIGLKSLERYYQYYFYEQNDEMSYKVDGKSAIGREDNLFDLLSKNHLSVKAYQRINNDSFPQISLRQSFMAASKAFQAIDSLTRGVIVPYGEKGKQIINELCASDILEKQYKLLKEAQRYSVNLFPYVFEKLASQQIIREVQQGSGVYYLDKQYYSDTFGVSPSIVNEMENLIL